MSRYYLDYTEEQDKNDQQNIGNNFHNWPLKLELSFRRRKQLKREIWDNARDKGWL